VKILLLAMLALAACDEDSTEAPHAKGCVEFDHDTRHNGEPVRCRMVWCEKSVVSMQLDIHNTGGVAVLWCDPVQKAAP
jgi:hypothetical protein